MGVAADVRATAGGRSFDVVIVGARCAGAALALRLASEGRSVALLDAARLPSDQTTSTHLIHPPGIDELEDLGIADAVRRESPALGAVWLCFDGARARLPYRDGRVAHCLRREKLDALLQQAAVEAGAELRDQSRVIDLVRDEHGTVRGVVVQHHGARTERIAVDLVVGADGRNSTIAKLTAAQEYLGYDGPRSVYWAYWQRPAGWDPHELHNTFEGHNARVIFPSDGDELLIATVPPIEIAERWRSRHTDAYLADIAAYEPISSHLGDARPVGRVRGVLRPRYFFRAAVGPGWALIGDARHHKEFVVGLGISDALRDARGLAQAILDEDPIAVERWWRWRDAEQVEMFSWSRELGDSRPVNGLQRLAAARLGESPALAYRLGDVLDGRLRPYDFVPTAGAARWILTSVLRGDATPLTPLFEVAGRRLLAGRERRMRRRLAMRLN
jgi:menaquinone-9 beta-reductase